MTEEQIMATLFAKVSAAPGFRVASRRLKLWGEVTQKPALYLYQRDSEYARDGDHVPARVTLNADVFIYAASSTGQAAYPATQLNALVAAVRATLVPDPATQRQTLGGLVHHCWIEGKTVFEPGDLDNDALAILPVKILVPTLS